MRCTVLLPVVSSSHMLHMFLDCYKLQGKQIAEKVSQQVRHVQRVRWLMLQYYDIVRTHYKWQVTGLGLGFRYKSTIRLCGISSIRNQDRKGRPGPKHFFSQGILRSKVCCDIVVSSGRSIPGPWHCQIFGITSLGLSLRTLQTLLSKNKRGCNKLPVQGQLQWKPAVKSWRTNLQGQSLTKWLNQENVGCRRIFLHRSSSTLDLRSQ